MVNDLVLMIPEIIVLLTAIAVLIAEMLRQPRIGFIAAIAGLSLATVLTIPLLGENTTAFSETFRIDVLSVWAKLILLPATILSLLLLRAELGGSDREGTAYVLIIMVTLASLIMAGVGDTMLLVLGVLLSGLGSFALVAYPRDDKATEAAMKYFVFASVTAGVMIFGLTYWFGGTGSTLLNELGILEKSPVLAAIGFIAVLIGLGYKAALVPFHFWAPDAYEGAPISVAAYLSVIPKIGAIFALAQVVRELPSESGWQWIIASIGVLTMTYGYLAALRQHNVVRLLAYSSIAQAGYLLLAVIAVGVSPLAFDSLIVFSAAYVAMNLGAFAIVMRLGRTLCKFKNIGFQQPFVGITMVVFLISLAGIPPLAGFVGKFLLFGAAMDAGFIWLVVIAIINSVLSLAVYLRIVVPMYQQETDSQTEKVLTVENALVKSAWLVCLIFTVLIGLAAQSLLGYV
ncbi:MAG: NADH-quinone oxidoreductase subunit N [Gammaproteobacteria bacterium]|nr:NADH-quinone oxidoreductase subunit N [Gammaproteobacteria bacterium]